MARAKEEKWGEIRDTSLPAMCHNICVVVQSIYELGIEPAFWQNGEL
jgi:hypothetical protein